MSYILEALKKSDRERKQTEPPVLETVYSPDASPLHPSRETESQRLSPFFLGFLAMLLAVVCVWFSVSVLPNYLPPPPSTAEVKETSLPTIPPAKKASSSKVASIPREPQTQTPNAITTPQTSDNLSTEAEKDLTTQKNIDIQTSTKQEPLTKTKQVYIPPLLSELPQAQQEEFPTLTFAGHVFSEEPTNRMIMINNKIIREGGIVEPHLQLEAITKNGVILRHKTTRFRIELF